MEASGIANQGTPHSFLNHYNFSQAFGSGDIQELLQEEDIQKDPAMAAAKALSDGAHEPAGSACRHVTWASPG